MGFTKVGLRTKRVYNTWKLEDMNNALLKHRNGELGFNEACRRYNIPKPTLRRHLKGLNKTTRLGRPNDMTTEVEEELAQHIINLESSFFRLTLTEVRKLAYDLAEKYQLSHRFNKDKKIAGKSWFYKFMKRHPNLFLRVSEATKSKGFNKDSINEFFDKYEEILDKHKFTADQIYNVDETALSTVLNPSKVIAKKGKHQVGTITSGERGLTTTGVYAMNAADEPEKLPEWTSIYYIKVSDNEMKCNLCDITFKVDEKSLELLEHMKVDHKDIYELHIGNPEATVGFRIEFLHLNMLKDDGDPKSESVILGEVCEALTEPIVPEKEEDEVEVSNKAADESNMHYVLLEGKKKTRKENAGPRKRSWVWKYFDKLSNIIYRCRLCNVVLSIKGCNSNNMNRHVRSRHPTVFKSEVTKRERVDNVHVITSETDTPYAIKTEEIYASDRDLEEVTDSPTQKLRRSWIWSYFDRVSNTQAQCKLCKRHICHGGNATGNMNRHLKMIHHKTACTYDQSWVWKVFEATETDFYSCKICRYKCMKCSDIDKSMTSILNHLKLAHGVVSGDQIITGPDVVETEEIL